ncbi:hypothetical protein [Streptomyces sp. S1]|uniref:hypothetical protein n=1 Tax=Streptomyces sp. S1 TaxID=718288 RepID=UPI003D724781
MSEELERVRFMIVPKDDGTVQFSILRATTLEAIYSVMLQGKNARKTAESLTMASWKAEDMKRARGDD